MVMAVLAGCDSSRLGPAVVEGLSMAPTLWGEYWTTTCKDCSFPYRCDEATLAGAGTSVCPNCGCAVNVRDDHVFHPAQPYTVIPGTDELKRWDVVAFHYPDGEARAGQRGVKRIVGLPGETISFRDGLVWVGDEPAAMDWDRVQETRILVHDSRYLPESTRSLPDRFAPRVRPNGWLPAGDMWNFEAASGEENRLQFLDYIHWRCCRHTGERTAIFPIEDYHPNDQSVSRELHPIDQLSVSVDFSMDLAGLFEVSLVRPYGSWVARVDRNRDRIELRLGRMEATMVPIGRASTQRATLELSSIGARLHATWNGELLGEWSDLLYADPRPPLASDGPLPDGQVPPPTPGSTISLAAAGGNVLVKQIKIFRGIHYFDEETAEDRPRTFQLGPDEFLLVGDNVARSIDSRQWQVPAVPRRSIIGVVAPRAIE